MSDAEMNRNQVAEALSFLFAEPDAAGRFALPPLSLPALLMEFLCAAPDAAPVTLIFLYRRFGDRPLFPQLAALMLHYLISCRVLPNQLTDTPRNEDVTFILRMGCRIWQALAAAASQELPGDQLLPAAGRMLREIPAFPSDTEEAMQILAEAIQAADPFQAHRMFHYEAGQFLPVRFDSRKPVDQFFGFPAIRAQFAEHFRRFAAAESNLPLLINSLPGHGKTSMVVSYALDNPGLIVILADPATLERDWQELMAPLARRPDHRFVVFFDDIDPNAVNWFHFRTHVGGAFALPENVLPVLSANYEFPANILSRGRRVTYPVFDELRCCEMVEDFLKTYGIRHHHRNLISQIAADYTEEFGQKKFTELSPRSLVRYLQGYEHDANKRKTIAAIASGPMVTRPDAQLFYEFNIELMRSLYGDEYIKRLLKERLNELERNP